MTRQQSPPTLTGDASASAERRLLWPFGQRFRSRAGTLYDDELRLLYDHFDIFA